MKRLVLLTAMIAYLPVANAEGKGEFNHDAEYRVRYLMEQNNQGNSNSATANTVNQRFKLGTTFKSGEKFSAHLSLLANTQFGDVTGNSGTAVHDGTTYGANNLVFVNQAYGTWMLSDSWALKFGRGGFTMADGSVVSQNDWQATPYAFDGILASYDHDNFRLSLFGVKAYDGTATTTDPEANFLGFALDWKSLPDFLKTAHVHFMKVKSDNIGGANWQDYMRYGLTLGGDTSGIDYKLNYAAHDGDQNVAGTKTATGGNMMHFDIGYSMPDFMKSRIHLAYHSDSGSVDKGNYNSFYYERHNAAGVMDVVYWGNLTFLNVGYTLEPMDQFTVGLQYWMFDRTSTDTGLGVGRTGAAPVGLYNAPGYTGAPTGTDKAIGSEIDLVATKVYDSGFKINAWYGMFTPGAYLKTVASPSNQNTYSQFFVEGKMTF